MTKDPGMDSQRTVTYKPSIMSFKEYDKKMKAFRPDLQYWEVVLTKENEWDALDANGDPKYDAAEIKLLQATDHIARSVYVLGNGGPTDVYTSKDTAYEIREALRSRYENTEQLGLTMLTEKFNEVVRGNPYGCPDIWFDNLQYYKELIVKAGGSAKTDAEIVAHVLATAPNSYDSVTTLILGKDLSDATTLKFARDQYRSYWKRHFELQQSKRNTRGYGNTATAYCVETKEKSEVNAITSGQGGRTIRNKAPGKPWKKFKGFCKICGIQGHKAVNCTKDKGNQEKRGQKETRKCYNCNKVGHLARDCTKKPNDTAFVGCILTNKAPEIDDTKIINSNEFDPITDLSWINVEDFADELEKEEGSNKVYFDKEEENCGWSILGIDRKMTLNHEVNMISSQYREEDEERSNEEGSDDYETDPEDPEYEDPDLGYMVPREQPVPRVPSTDNNYYDVTHKYDFRCYGCKSKMTSVTDDIGNIE